MRRLVKGPRLLNVVWRGKTPQVAFGEAERMGYRFADRARHAVQGRHRNLRRARVESRSTDRHPVPMYSMTVREAFRRAGADEWDAINDRFGVAKPPATAAE